MPCGILTSEFLSVEKDFHEVKSLQFVPLPLNVPIIYWKTALLLISKSYPLFLFLFSLSQSNIITLNWLENGTLARQLIWIANLYLCTNPKSGCSWYDFICSISVAMSKCFLVWCHTILSLFILIQFNFPSLIYIEFFIWSAILETSHLFVARIFLLLPPPSKICNFCTLKLKNYFCGHFRDFHDCMRVFTQFHTAQEHEQYLQNLQKEREIKIRISELARYRRNGLTRHEECAHFEQERIQHEEWKEKRSVSCTFFRWLNNCNQLGVLFY